MVILDAGTSNRGAMRSSSTVMPPSGDGAAAAFALAPVWAENLRSHSLRRATGRHPAHRSVWPPMRPNMITMLVLATCCFGKKTWMQTSQTRQTCNSPSARRSILPSSIEPSPCRLSRGRSAIFAGLASRFVLRSWISQEDTIANSAVQEYGHQMQVRSRITREIRSIAGVGD